MNSYTLGILSGGLGRRVGGADKGWLLWHGTPLIQHQLNKFSTADATIISANRELPRYQTLPATIVSDLRTDFCGPLAGIETIINAAIEQRSLWPLVIISCDMPNLPENLPERLISVLDGAGISVAHDGQQQQHLCLALADKGCLFDLQRYLDSGERSVHGWLKQKNPVIVAFDHGADAFSNINHSDQLRTPPANKPNPNLD